MRSTLTDQGGTYNWQIAINGHIKVPLALFLTINDPEVSQKTGLPVGTTLGYVGNSSLPPPSNPTQIQGTWKLKIVTEVDPSTGQLKSLSPPADESAYSVFQGNQVCDHSFKGKILKEKKCASFSIDGFNFSRERATLNWGIDSNGFLELIFPGGKGGFGYEKSTLPSTIASSPPPSTSKPSPASVEKTPEATSKTDASVYFIALGAFFAGLFLWLIATWIFRDFFARIEWIKRDESGKPLWISGWTLKGRVLNFLIVLMLVGGTLVFVGFQEFRKDNPLQVSPKSEDKPVNNTLVPKNLPSKSGEQLTFRPTPLPGGVVGFPYTFSFCRPALNRTSDLCSAFDKPSTNPSGGQPPYHFQLGSGIGFPPFGLNLNLNGLLTGTPTAAGTKQFSVCAIDQAGASSCQSVTLTIRSVEQQPTTQEPAPSQTGTSVTIQSVSCTLSSEPNFNTTLKFYRIVLSGGVSGPAGTSLIVNGNFPVSIPSPLSCSGWGMSGGYTCMSGSGPASTNWSYIEDPSPFPVGQTNYTFNFNALLYVNNNFVTQKSVTFTCPH